MEQKKERFRIFLQAADRIGSMQIPLYAANACYFFVLSIFPLLLIVLSLVPYLPYSARDLLELVERVVPGALMGVVETLIVHIYYSSSHAMLGLSAVVSLWSASKAIFGIMSGLNHIYGVKEDRSRLYTRLISLVYTLLFIILLVLTLVMQVFGPAMMSWFDAVETDHRPPRCADACHPDGPVYGPLHGAAQPAESVSGIPARCGHCGCGLAGVHRAVFLLCGAFEQPAEPLWFGVCHGAEYAVAVLLHGDFAVRRRCEPADPAMAAEMIGNYVFFVNFRGRLRCVHNCTVAYL